MSCLYKVGDFVRVAEEYASRICVVGLDAHSVYEVTGIQEGIRDGWRIGVKGPSRGFLDWFCEEWFEPTRPPASISTGERLYGLVREWNPQLAYWPHIDESEKERWKSTATKYHEMLMDQNGNVTSPWPTAPLAELIPGTEDPRSPSLP